MIIYNNGYTEIITRSEFGVLTMRNKPLVITYGRDKNTGKATKSNNDNEKKVESISFKRFDQTELLWESNIDEDNQLSVLTETNSPDLNPGRYGYKAVHSLEGKPCVAKLKLLPDSKVAGGDNIKLRTDKALVIAIWKFVVDGDKVTYLTDQSEEPILEAIPCIYKDKEFKYKVGNIAQVDDFDPDLSKVCVPGIHYVLSPKDVFHFHNLKEIHVTNENDVIAYHGDEKLADNEKQNIDINVPVIETGTIPTRVDEKPREEIESPNISPAPNSTSSDFIGKTNTDLSKSAYVTVNSNVSSSSHSPSSVTFSSSPPLKVTPADSVATLKPTSADFTPLLKASSSSFIPSFNSASSSFTSSLKPSSTTFTPSLNSSSTTFTPSSNSGTSNFIPFINPSSSEFIQNLNFDQTTPPVNYYQTSFMPTTYYPQAYDATSSYYIPPSSGLYISPPTSSGLFVPPSNPQSPSLRLTSSSVEQTKGAKKQ
jgi:hypothetical protein